MITTVQLPALNDNYSLSASQVDSFRINGHVLLRAVASREEVASYRPIINNAVLKNNKENRKLEDRDTYGKAFLQITNLWETDEEVKKFTLAKRFAGIAARLLGVEKVRVYHDQALYKEAGGGHTPWHQDQYYWPLDTPNTITMWMPLVDISKETGMLRFASGSHRKGFVENIPISDKSEEILQQHIKSQNYPISTPDYMSAGDATWHAGWTLHSAPGNASDSLTREVMTIIYFADGARIIEPQNEHQEADRNRWLKGMPAGSLATSELNPLV